MKLNGEKGQFDGAFISQQSVKGLWLRERQAKSRSRECEVAAK